jgi:ribosomal protein S17
MLLCVVTEETMEETVVVTVFKTSQLEKYLREVRR